MMKIQFRNQIVAFVLFIMGFVFLGCSTKQVEVVDQFYGNGQAKIVMTYQIQRNDSIPMHEVQYHKDGSILLEGDYRDGLREGEWISHFPDGSIWSKGYFSQGNRTGKSWVYHPNGQLRMKGAYENGEKVGKWFVYDENGIVVGDEDF